MLQKNAGFRLKPFSNCNVHHLSSLQAYSQQRFRKKNLNIFLWLSKLIKSKPVLALNIKRATLDHSQRYWRFYTSSGWIESVKCSRKIAPETTYSQTLFASIDLNLLYLFYSNVILGNRLADKHWVRKTKDRSQWRVNSKPMIIIGW